MNIYHSVNHCRICKGNTLTDVIHLGEQYITSRFPNKGDFSTPKTPIDLCLCNDCGLLQLRQSTQSSELYEYEYGYRSGISNTMKEHLKLYQEEIESMISLQPGDIVLDIGSNDSTMLQYYSSQYKRIGMDPTGKQFEQYYHEVELVADYFTKNNFVAKYGDCKCKVVSSISMFYDLPDPVQFAQDIYDILDDDGIWTCEQSYVLTMLEQNSFDTICHEHLEYYGLHQIQKIAEMSRFKIIDVKFNSCNGGSFRIYFCKNISTKYTENIEYIQSILQNEIQHKINDPQTYLDFMKKCDEEMNKLCNLIRTIQQNQQQIWIYGASTKGNCLLQYANIDASMVPYAVERNPQKIGKMTPTGTEIIGEEQMRTTPPEFLLVLPWHFREEIIKRESIYLENGGQLVFPLPTMEIYSHKKKVLITGCDGHIASYLKEELSPQKYCFYGFCQNIHTKNPNMLKFVFDLCHRPTLEFNMLTIQPDMVVHLASISSSIKAFFHPIDTVQTNGMVTANLCDIIHKHHLSTSLFHASSSEIYKGHSVYTVKENDNNMYCNHPYSIAKIMGHSMVDFYRNTYQLPFSNGIIFCTESPRKSKDFLLNKVAYHATHWNPDTNSAPLVLGSLDSFRNILHAMDVAKAIEIIVNQPTGENYLICNEQTVGIQQLVLQIYEKAGFILQERDHIFYESNSQLPIIRIEHTNNGLNNSFTNIDGYPTKLKSLGWTPSITTDELIQSIVMNASDQE